MKTLRLTIFVWLAAGVVAQAQSQFNTDQSPAQRFGANPSSPPNVFQNQKPLVASPTTSANLGNSTTSFGSPLGNGNLTVPGLTQPDAASTATAASTTTTASANTTVAKTVPDEPDLSVMLPQTMEMNDGSHQLAPYDRFLIKVVEDGDPPYMLYLNGQGEIENLHYHQGKIKAQGMYLQTLATLLKKDYESTYYNKATVLMALTKSSNVRSHVNVMGEVSHPGPVDYPPDQKLTLYEALQATGPFTPIADLEHITVIHRNPVDPNNPGDAVTRTSYNIADMLANAIEPDMAVEPGDFIMVQSKSQSGSYVTISGEVAREMNLPLSPTDKTTVNDALLQAGWTDWSNHKVTLIHFDENYKQTGRQTVDIDAIRLGEKDKDVRLQPRDMIVVARKWLALGY